MPINSQGQYYSTPLISGLTGSNKNLNQETQSRVFGDTTWKDMNDYSAFALNKMMWDQQNAYNLQLWKLQNEYDSPSAQMQRFQDAGLNPNLIYSQMQAGNNVSTQSMPEAKSFGTANKSVNTALSALSQLKAIVETTADISEALSRNDVRSWQALNTQAQAGLNNARYNYELWLNGYLRDPDNPIASSPRASMYHTQQDAQKAKIDQLKAVVSLVPDNKARQQALTEIEKERLAIMKGQNDAILNIKTGSDTWDSVLKMLSYFLINQKYW